MILLFLAIAFAQTYPNTALTPGVTRQVSKEVLCTAGSTKDARLVTAKMKRQVFERYGFVQGKYKPGDYEIDHEISLELGGANDIQNLWVQPYCPKGNDPFKSGCWGAREKDMVETNLHRRICKGTLTIEEAQNIIRTDWVAEYKKIKGIK
jgi:hypothetical protein